MIQSIEPQAGPLFQSYTPGLTFGGGSIQGLMNIAHINENFTGSHGDVLFKEKVPSMQGPMGEFVISNMGNLAKDSSSDKVYGSLIRTKAILCIKDLMNFRKISNALDSFENYVPKEVINSTGLYSLPKDIVFIGNSLQFSGLQELLEMYTQIPQVNCKAHFPEYGAYALALGLYHHKK